MFFFFSCFFCMLSLTQNPYCNFLRYFLQHIFMIICTTYKKIMEILQTDFEIFSVKDISPFQNKSVIIWTDELLKLRNSKNCFIFYVSVFTQHQEKLICFFISLRLFMCHEQKQICFMFCWCVFFTLYRNRFVLYFTAMFLLVFIETDLFYILLICFC